MTARALERVSVRQAELVERSEEPAEPSQESGTEEPTVPPMPETKSAVQPTQSPPEENPWKGRRKKYQKWLF